MAACNDAAEGAHASEGRPQDTGAVATTERAGAAGARPVTRRALVTGTSVMNAPPAGDACPTDDAWAREHTTPRAGCSAGRCPPVWPES